MIFKRSQRLAVVPLERGHLVRVALPGDTADSPTAWRIAESYCRKCRRRIGGYPFIVVSSAYWHLDCLPIRRKDIP